MSLGTIPGKEALHGVPVLKCSGGDGEEVVESPEAIIAKQASSLMSMLSVQAECGLHKKCGKVWLGEGLGSVSKRIYERMMRWEFVDLGELRTRSLQDKVTVEGDTQKLVVLPGFEVTQPRQKPISDILVWVQCFSKYAAAMSQKFPSCTSGLMSHLLVVLKAAMEVEGVSWRLYDEAFRDKMAAIGVREWAGMDVQLYQEICGSHPRKIVGQFHEGKGHGIVGVRRLGSEKRPSVCWLFNEGKCTYGAKCKFPHVCEMCGGNHSKSRCSNPKRQRL